MSDIVKITDHGSEAVDRLVTQFKDKERITGIVEAIGGQIQGLEDVSCDLIDDRKIDTAEGVQLDKIGKIVGRRRLGLSDASYRQVIKAQIGINTSNGHLEDLFFVFNLITGSTQSIYVPYQVAMLEIYANTDISSLDIGQLYADLQRTVPGGVRVHAIGWFDGGGGTGEDEAFSFAESLTGKGFSDVNDPEVGGKLAQILIP